MGVLAIAGTAGSPGKVAFSASFSICCFLSLSSAPLTLLASTIVSTRNALFKSGLYIPHWLGVVKVSLQVGGWHGLPARHEIRTEINEAANLQVSLTNLEGYEPASYVVIGSDSDLGALQI